MSTQDTQPHEPSRQFSAENVIQLADLLKSKINFVGQGPPKRPWGDKPTPAAFKKAFESGVHELPLEYVEAYAQPLEKQLTRLAKQAETPSGKRDAEALLGAVYCHAHDNEVAAPMRRLMAVTSYIFRSFLDAERLAKVNLPMIEQLPPLATLKQWGGAGPYTIPTQEIRKKIGSKVAVVSMPSVLREHPVLWSILGHEVGGHDVQNADPGLQGELAFGVRRMFDQSWARFSRNGQPALAEINRIFGKLWSYWMNEAAADVYAIMNVGPVSIMSLCAKMMARLGATEIGVDRVPGKGQWLGSHPIQVLRLHLGIGAVEALSGLNETTRAKYVSVLQELAQRTCGGRTNVKLLGMLPDVTGGPAEPIDLEIPLAIMQGGAQCAGNYIATAQLNALNGYNIQQIETWDDSDEETVRSVIQSIREHNEIGLSGDPAHLLSAGACAMMKDPSSYDDVNKHLNAGLDRCYDRDPIWGKFDHDHHAELRFDHAPKNPKS